MAIAFDAVSGGVNAEQSSLTFSHAAAGADRYAVIVVATMSNQTNTPVTTTCAYAGNSCVFVAGDGRSLGTNRYLRVDVFVLANPPTGSQAVVASFSGAACLAAAVIVATYTGVATHGTYGNADNNNATPGCVVTTAVDEARIVGGVVAYDGGTQGISPGTATTERLEIDAPGHYLSDDITAALADEAVATAGATAFDFTLVNAAHWGLVAVELRPVATAGGKPTVYYLNLLNN